MAQDSCFDVEKIHAVHPCTPGQQALRGLLPSVAHTTTAVLRGPDTTKEACHEVLALTTFTTTYLTEEEPRPGS